MNIKETYETFLAQTGNDLVAASLTLASVLQAEQQPPMLTVDEAALRLNLCTKKVYSMCRLGELPSVKVGRVVRIPVEEIERFEANIRRPKAPPRLTGYQHF